MKWKNWKRRIVSAVLCTAVWTASIFGSVPSRAATFEDINQIEVFLKQQPGSNTCTLVAGTMLVRRAAMLNDNPNWADLTVDVMRSAAWVTGTGLKHSFNCSGIYVENSSFSGSTDEMISLLASHPEGIVIYDRAKPHAILVTDYTGGVFYAADPAPGTPEGRVPISSATVTVEGADDIWYVASPSLYLKDKDGNIISKEEVATSVKPAATASPSPTPVPSTTATAKATAAAKATETPKTVKAPKKVSGVKVTNKAVKSVQVSWKAVSAAKGYEILYADNAQFKKYKYVYLQHKKYKLSHLKKGKHYYIKVRAYKTNGDEMVYGKWSKIKKVKVKK